MRLAPLAALGLAACAPPDGVVAWTVALAPPVPIPERAKDIIGAKGLVAANVTGRSVRVTVEALPPIADAAQRYVACVLLGDRAILPRAADAGATPVGRYVLGEVVPDASGHATLDVAPTTADLAIATGAAIVRAARDLESAPVRVLEGTIGNAGDEAASAPPAASSGHHH